MTNDLLENLRQVVKKKMPSTLVHTIKFPTGIEYPYGMNDGTVAVKYVFPIKHILLTCRKTLLPLKVGPW